MLVSSLLAASPRTGRTASAAARDGWWLDAVIWDIPEPVPPTWTSDWVSRYAR